MGVVGNIPGEGLRRGDVSAATEVSPFRPPGLKSGSHRYFYFLFEQTSGQIDYTVLPRTGRQWDYEAFITQYGLGAPIASNWHVTQFGEPRSEANTELVITDGARDEAEAYPQGLALLGGCGLVLVGAVILSGRRMQTSGSSVAEVEMRSTC